MSGTERVKLKDPRILRIFLSSPFRGMEVERERLTSIYWPRLRTALVSKGILLRVVDMRWGISTEMSSVHETINICLREIDRSDIFIGLYGQRYGWHGGEDIELQKNFDKAQSQYPWVDQHRDRSVTELEFMHGHLNNPGAMASCFALRDPKYDKQEWLKAQETGNQKAEMSHSPESEFSLGYLVDLKRRITESEKDTIGLTVNYKTPEDCAEYVYNCVRKYIDEEILVKMTKSLSVYQTSQLAHDAYLKRRTGKYVSGDPYFKALDKIVDQEGEVGPIVLTGPTGSEKASLLGSWLQLRKSRDGNRDIVIAHFLNAEPRASNPTHLLMRLVGNMEEKVIGRKTIVSKLEIDSSILLQKMDDLFVEVQQEEHKDKKVIIIVDMVEQILPEKSNRPLFMIPRTLPQNVRIILTVILGSEASQETLRILEEDYSSPRIDIGPLREIDKRNLSTLLLEQHSKSLSPEQLEKIVTSEKTSNPYFLHNLILELCISGRFRELDKQIETFLNCKDGVELLCHILKRVEEEHDHPDYEGNLVKDVLCSIALCNRGISESEFPMPEFMWVHIVYALRDHIIDRSGLLSFAFPELKQAVAKLYMPDDESRKEAARKVCRIFYEQFMESVQQRLPLPRRVALELPHLMHDIDDPDELKNVISNITVFKVLSKAAPGELLGHWQVLGCSGYVVARSYLSSLDNECAKLYVTYLENNNHEGILELSSMKADLLREIRLWMTESDLMDGVELIFDKEIMVLARMSGKGKVDCIKWRCKTRFEKAVFLTTSERYAEAFQHHTDVLRARKHLFSQGLLENSSIYDSYHALGRCCSKLKRFDEAEQWFTLAFNVIKEDPGQKENLAWDYHNLGIIAHSKGNQKAAIDYFDKAISLWEGMHRLSSGLAAAFLKLGSAYQAKGDLDSAEISYNKSLKINKTVHGLNSVGFAKALSGLSLLEEKRKDHWKSLRLITRSLKIFKNKAPTHRLVTIAAETRARQMKELNLQDSVDLNEELLLEI